MVVLVNFLDVGFFFPSFFLIFFRLTFFEGAPHPLAPPLHTGLVQVYDAPFIRPYWFNKRKFLKLNLSDIMLEGQYCSFCFEEILCAIFVNSWSYHTQFCLVQHVLLENHIWKPFCRLWVQSSFFFHSKNVPLMNFVKDIKIL